LDNSRKGYTAVPLSKKYYNAIKTIKFDSAPMNKQSYNALKGLGATVALLAG